MLALPDGQKVYAEDVEAILRQDERLTDAAVVGWPTGADLRVHAVLLLDDPAAAEDVVRAANGRLAPHQRIRGFTVWPEEDLPRTHTLKVKKPLVLERLPELIAAAEAGAATATPGSTKIGAKLDALPADPVAAVIAEVAGVPADRLVPTARLESDLEMDSLKRVELLGVIEEELGIYLDDDALAPDATVAEVAAMIEAARGQKRKPMRWGWPLSPLVRAVGVASQLFVMYPLATVFYRVRTTGMEALRDLDGPVLITPNHCLHLDNAIILSRLPLSVRWKLSVAAGAETIYGNRVKGVLASILANAFPLAREGSVRRQPRAPRDAARQGLPHPPVPGGEADRGRAAPAVQGRGRAHRGGGRDADRSGEAAGEPDLDHRPAPPPERAPRRRGARRRHAARLRRGHRRGGGDGPARGGGRGALMPYRHPSALCRRAARPHNPRDGPARQQSGHGRPCGRVRRAPRRP